VFGEILRRQCAEFAGTFASDGRAVFHDLARLRRLAEHHGGYLDQNTNPP
jgi:hypothetical protein